MAKKRKQKEKKNCLYINTHKNTETIIQNTQKNLIPVLFEFL